MAGTLVDCLDIDRAGGSTSFVSFLAPLERALVYLAETIVGLFSSTFFVDYPLFIFLGCDFSSFLSFGLDFPPFCGS